MFKALKIIWNYELYFNKLYNPIKQKFKQKFKHPYGNGPDSWCESHTKIKFSP